MKEFSHWGKTITVSWQEEYFAELPDSFFSIQMTNSLDKDRRSRGEACRLSETLRQHWRKAGLITYGDGKWYKVKHEPRV